MVKIKCNTNVVFNFLIAKTEFSPIPESSSSEKTLLRMVVETK